MFPSSARFSSLMCGSCVIARVTLERSKYRFDLGQLHSSRHSALGCSPRKRWSAASRCPSRHFRLLLEFFLTFSYLHETARSRRVIGWSSPGPFIVHDRESAARCYCFRGPKALNNWCGGAWFTVGFSAHCTDLVLRQSASGGLRRMAVSLAFLPSLLAIT